MPSLRANCVPNNIGSTWAHLTPAQLWGTFNAQSKLSPAPGSCRRGPPAEARQQHERHAVGPAEARLHDVLALPARLPRLSRVVLLKLRAQPAQLSGAHHELQQYSAWRSFEQVREHQQCNGKHPTICPYSCQPR